MTNNPSRPFTMMYVETTDSPAWRALPHGARSLYLFMKRHYNRKKQKSVFLSIRTAAKELGASRNTVAGWRRALTGAGFIVQIQRGFLAIDGHGKAATYRLTDEPFEGQSPTRDFVRRNGNGKQKPGSKTEPPGSKTEPLVAQKLSHPRPKNQQNRVAQKLRHI